MAGKEFTVTAVGERQYRACRDAVYEQSAGDEILWKEDTKTGNEHIVATICLYEEDQSVVPYAGSYDCFAGHETATEALARLTTEESTGLGRDIDSWYAMALMCDDVTIPDTPSTEIARAGMCQGMHNVYPKRLQSFIAKYGENSPQVRFVRTEATARKLAMP